MKRPYVEICARCEAGELANYEYCLRDVPGSEGKCPIADKGPRLLPANVMAVEIFQECQGSCKQVAAEDKTYLYIDPCAAEALMRMRGIFQEEQSELMEKLMVLQGVANHQRRPRPKQMPKNKTV